MKRVSSISLFLAGGALALWLALALPGCGGKGPIVADVNGSSITEREFLKTLKGSPYGQLVLSQLIMERLIMDELKKHNLEVTDAEVNKYYKQEWQQRGFPNEAEFIKYMQSRGGGKDMALRDIRLGLAREKLLMKDVKATPEDIKRYFEQNRERYDTPETVTLSVIVVNEKATADKVIRDLGEGRQWADLAREVSLPGSLIEPTPVAVSMLPTLFNNDKSVVAAVEKLEKGAHTPPLRTVTRNAETGKDEERYDLVRLIDRKPKVPAKFEDVKDSVGQVYKLEQALKRKLADFNYDKQTNEQARLQMLQQARQMAESEILRNLQKTANVVVRDPDLMQVEKMFGAPTAATPGLVPPTSQPSVTPPSSSREGGKGK